MIIIVDCQNVSNIEALPGGVACLNLKMSHVGVLLHFTSLGITAREIDLVVITFGNILGVSETIVG